MSGAHKSIATVILEVLVIWGSVHPMMHFIAWFEAEGYALGPLIDAWYVNSATEGLVWDLTIAAVTLSVWALWASVTRYFWYVLVVPATFCIGVSCGLPLMLLILLRQTREG